MPGSIDASGLIPPEFSRQIISEATQQSIVLQQGNRIPMGSREIQMPVPAGFPSASWISTPGGRKPVTELGLTLQNMTAEELALTLVIPDVWVEDAAIDLWGYARPLVAEAMALALDNAVLWGIDRPASFPDGGLAATAQTITGGTDIVDTINQAMGAVEAQGLQVTGSAADISVRAALRGVREPGSGAFLLGYGQADNQGRDTLYGIPISYEQFDAAASGDFITGCWRYLMVGVRSDMRYRMSQEGTIFPSSGEAISLFQDNMTALKVWARYGCVVIHPATRRNPGGANPFAIANVGAGIGPSNPGNGGSAGGPGNGGTGGGDGGAGGGATLSASAQKAQGRRAGG